jgi:hypothetical protein
MGRLPALRCVIAALLCFSGLSVKTAIAAVDGFTRVASLEWGYHMGVASYWASVNSRGNALKELHQARKWANLVKLGFDPVAVYYQVPPSGLHEGIAAKRRQYEIIIKLKRSIRASKIYRVGLLLGIARGHAVGWSNLAQNYALQSLQGAEGVLRQLYAGAVYQCFHAEITIAKQRLLYKQQSQFVQSLQRLRNLVKNAVVTNTPRQCGGGGGGGGSAGGGSSGGSGGGGGTLTLIAVKGQAVPFIKKITSVSFRISNTATGLLNYTVSAYKSGNQWRGSTAINNKFYGKNAVQVTINFQMEKTPGVVENRTETKYFNGQLSQASGSRTWTFYLIWKQADLFDINSQLPKQGGQYGGPNRPGGIRFPGRPGINPGRPGYNPRRPGTYPGRGAGGRCGVCGQTYLNAVRGSVRLARTARNRVAIASRRYAHCVRRVHGGCRQTQAYRVYRNGVSRCYRFRHGGHFARCVAQAVR